MSQRPNKREMASKAAFQIEHLKTELQISQTKEKKLVDQLHARDEMWCDLIKKMLLLVHSEREAEITRADTAPKVVETVRMALFDKTQAVLDIDRKLADKNALVRRLQDQLYAREKELYSYQEKIKHPLVQKAMKDAEYSIALQDKNEEYLRYEHDLRYRPQRFR